MNELWRIFIDPWTAASLRDYWPVIVQGVLVSVALGVLGCFLVVRGTAMLGDALSHSVLPGIVVGFLIGGSLSSSWILVGATAVGVLAAFLVRAVQENSRIKDDASLGIVFTALFALGVLLINLYSKGVDLDPGCVLYGNIEHFVFKRQGMWTMGTLLGLIVVLTIVFYRQVVASLFDPALATSLGIPARAVNNVLMFVLTLTIVAAFESVGAILSVALVILPGATARLLSDRLGRMVVLAAGIAVTTTLLGYWLSRIVGRTSTTGAICTAAFAVFLLVWLLSPRQGLVVSWLRQRRLRISIEGAASEATGAMSDQTL